MSTYLNRISPPSVILTVFAALALLFAPPALANSVEDDSGVSWTATREYNSSSQGYDIKVVTDESPASVYWVTADSGGDEAPWIAIDPATGYPVVAWSKAVMGGSRIRISWYDGSDFGSPQTVTSGGTQYGDETPHMVIESDGDIHLVFFRDHSSIDGEAVYMKYTASWSTPEVYSASGDDVIGSCMIKLIDESAGELESEYEYDQSSKRDRCKPSGNDPWTSCE
jgi:hypothetical protein